jgi:hypothetical protein
MRTQVFKHPLAVNRDHGHFREVQATGNLPAGARFLHKPYAVAHLTDALKELTEP